VSREPATVPVAERNPRVEKFKINCDGTGRSFARPARNGDMAARIR
jgi:hypothetical protein